MQRAMQFARLAQPPCLSVFGKWAVECYMHPTADGVQCRGDSKYREECSRGNFTTDECLKGVSICTEECFRRNFTTNARKSAPSVTQNAWESALGVISLPSQGRVLPVYLKCTVECSQRARVLLEKVLHALGRTRVLSVDSKHMAECSRRNQTTMLSASGVFITHECSRR